MLLQNLDILSREGVYLAYHFGGESLSIIAWALLKTSWLNHLMVDGVLTGYIHIYTCTHMRERSRAEKESQRVARVPQEQPYPFPRAHPAKT